MTTLFPSAEITGVTIDYTEIDFWTAQEKMNVAIASGDYAALISDLTYTGGATGALEDGVIVDLTDRLPDYSPNYQYMNIKKTSSPCLEC